MNYKVNERKSKRKRNQILNPILLKDLKNYRALLRKLNNYSFRLKPKNRSEFSLNRNLPCRSLLQMSQASKKRAVDY